jgi:hypothetical protein
MSDAKAGDQIPVLGDVMEFPDEQRDDDRRWIVLYPEDYDNFGRDPDGNLAVLVDQEQAGEVLSLCAQTVAALSPRDAEGDDVLRNMRDALNRQIGGDDVDD